MTDDTNLRPPQLPGDKLSETHHPPPLGQSSQDDTQRYYLLGGLAALAVLAALLALLLMLMPPLNPDETGGDGVNASTSTDGTSSDNNSEGSVDGSETVSGGPDHSEDKASTSEKKVVDNHEQPFQSINSGKEENVEASTQAGEESDEAETNFRTNDVEDEESSLDISSEERTNSFFTLGGKGRPKEVATTMRDKDVSKSNLTDALRGREGSNKGELLKAYGGTEVTEAAVKLGLEWLARNQLDSGLWSLQGPYQGPGSAENHAVATALALLAFQGAGHTPKGDSSHPFTRVVAKGWDAFLKHLSFDNKQQISLGLHGGYTQAICTIALCEALGMTGNNRYRIPARKAVSYCIDAQSAQGGWRYQPRIGSDTSVTGWFVMALQSARMAKLKIDRRTISMVSSYLDNASTHYGEQYCYQPGGPATRSMTAEALLCRQYLGWKRNNAKLVGGTNYLLEEPPSWHKRNVYYWYYATQVTHHMGGDYWDQWNTVMRELLPEKQIKNGPESGSWEPAGDAYGSAGGRLYVTCLSLYMLEVYYRHLPIYQDRALNLSK